MSFTGGSVIHLRPSGNAPELRCYTEMDNEESARSLNAAALKLVREFVHDAALAQTIASGEAQALD